MFKFLQVSAILTGVTLTSLLPAQAASVSQMTANCRNLAAQKYGAKATNISVKYEGQRTDGTHAVNGTYETSKMVNTFQCSFNRSGTKVVKFTKNTPHSKVDEGAL